MSDIQIGLSIVVLACLFGIWVLLSMLKDEE